MHHSTCRYVDDSDLVKSEMNNTTVVSRLTNVKKQTVQIIKFHKRRMRALAQAKEANQANQLNVPLVNSPV